MTCIVGIRSSAGVLIAGDSIGTNRTTSEVRVDPKVFAEGSLAFGHTTSFRWGQILQFYSLPALARGKSAPTAADDLYRWAVTVFVPQVRSDLAEHGWLRKEHEREEGGRALVAVGDRLFAVHSDFFRRINADTHLISFHTQDGDRDIAPDHDRLTSASCQYQHDPYSPSLQGSCPVLAYAWYFLNSCNTSRNWNRMPAEPSFWTIWSVFSI